MALALRIFKFLVMLFREKSFLDVDIQFVELLFVCFRWIIFPLILKTWHIVH